jgi:hypothetical protein
MSTRFSDELKELREALAKELASAKDQKDRERANLQALQALGIDLSTSSGMQQREQQRLMQNAAMQDQRNMWLQAQLEYRDDMEKRYGEQPKQTPEDPSFLLPYMEEAPGAVEQATVRAMSSWWRSQPIVANVPEPLIVPASDVFPRTPPPMAVYCPRHEESCAPRTMDRNRSLWVCPIKGCDFQFDFTIETARGFIQANWILNSVRIEQQIRDQDQADIPCCPLCLVPLNWAAQNKTWACLTCPFNITDGYLEQFRGGRTSRKFVMVPVPNVAGANEKLWTRTVARREMDASKDIVTMLATYSGEAKKLLIEWMQKDVRVLSEFIRDPGAMRDKLEAAVAARVGQGPALGERKINLDGE